MRCPIIPTCPPSCFSAVMLISEACEFFQRRLRIHIYVYIYIYCYHRSSVNIAFGVSRSELTKPGDQSMAGFDFINNTIKSGDRSMAGLDLIEVYISK